MTYKVSPPFRKSLMKLKKKNKALYKQIHKKIEEIIASPEHYKPLRNKLKGFRRAHIGSFVIIYKIKEEVIEFIGLDHHDKAY